MADPHDALFKKTFANPEHALGELRAILPRRVSECIDWPTLALCPGSFVDDDLDKRHTDLLYTASLESGDQVYLYLLFEHQSGCDPLMAYRLLIYMARIWERCLADDENARRLPPIIPLVLYHGNAAWSAATDFTALIDAPPDVLDALGDFVPSFRYLVDDLGTQPDDALRQRATTALATVMRYILTVSRHVDRSQLENVLETHVGPRAKEVLVTIGEQLIEQGALRGYRAGCLAILTKIGDVSEEVKEHIDGIGDSGTLEKLLDELSRAADAEAALAAVRRIR